jgi:hypothetical protein
MVPTRVGSRAAAAFCDLISRSLRSKRLEGWLSEIGSSLQDEATTNVDEVDAVASAFARL